MAGGGGKRPGGRVFIGLGLGLAGATLLFAPALDTGTGGYDLAGLGLALLGALVFAIGSLYSRHAPLPEDTRIGTASERRAGEPARLFALTGGLAIIVIVVAGLTGHRPGTIGVATLLHFGGYASLAAVLVLGLRVRWQLPALASCVALGLLIELLQPLNRRSFEPADVLANAPGGDTA
jgi:drug/metabolite transporter (DMT)-like permease